MHLRSLVNSLTCPQLFAVSIKIMLADSVDFDITYMAVLIFPKNFDLRKKCVFSDSLLGQEMPTTQKIRFFYLFSCPETISSTSQLPAGIETSSHTTTLSR